MIAPLDRSRLGGGARFMHFDPERRVAQMRIRFVNRGECEYLKNEASAEKIGRIRSGPRGLAVRVGLKLEDERDYLAAESLAPGLKGRRPRDGTLADLAMKQRAIVLAGGLHRRADGLVAELR